MHVSRCDRGVSGAITVTDHEHIHHDHPQQLTELPIDLLEGFRARAGELDRTNELLPR